MNWVCIFQTMECPYTTLVRFSLYYNNLSIFSCFSFIFSLCSFLLFLLLVFTCVTHTSFLYYRNYKCFFIGYNIRQFYIIFKNISIVHNPVNLFMRSQKLFALFYFAFYIRNRISRLYSNGDVVKFG